MGVTAGVSHQEVVRPPWAVPGAWGAGCARPRKATPQLGTRQIPPTSFREASFCDPERLLRAGEGRVMRPSPQPRGFPGRAGAPGTLAAGSGRAARLPRPRPAASVSDDAPAETPTRPPGSAARFHFPSPCPAWGAGLSPPRIPTGVGTGALPAVGRGGRRGYDGAARPRPAPSSPRLRRHRGWGRAVPGRPEIDPLPREGRDQVRAGVGAARAATTPTPQPGRAVRGPGGGASWGRRGAGGRKCALPPRPEHSDPLPSEARGRIGMARERGVPWGGGASQARCAGASPRSGVGWGLPVL